MTTDVPPPVPPPTAGAEVAGPPAADHPVRLGVVHQPEYSRFLPLVKWLLAIPHYVVLAFLILGAFLAIIVSFFAVLITGRYPRGLFEFVVGVSRWGTRVLAYLLLMTDRYPAFSLAPEPGDPVELSVEYPEEVSRWRPLVHWLLVLPYAFVASMLMQLAYLLSFFALFTILFTKRFPRGMFDINVVAMRWQVRANAYMIWLTTRYPPFAWG
jgi:hypothetical protein